MNIIKSAFQRGFDKANMLIIGSFFVQAAPPDSEVIIDARALNFKIPNFSDVLTFMVRFFFVLAGISALLYLLWGSLQWVISGGEKENVEKARNKIVNALVGVMIIVGTLSLIWTLEQVVFSKRLCFGITCPLTLPELLKAP